MANSLAKSFRERQHLLWLTLLTVALSVGWFLLDGNVKLNLADEGYLWYGTHALRQGEVPMRDFEAYDPGRYVWTAGWSCILGEGVAALRLACVFFQCLGVLAGLLTARRLSRNWGFLTCTAILLCAWMHPRYKLFEQSIALMAVYAGVLLLESPTLRRHWWVGVFGGLSAFFGRNHGAYHVVAFALLISWAAWENGPRLWFRRGVIWIAGLIVGYLPQWLMFLFVPGFFRAFGKYLAAMFVSGSTNLPVPVPWPWVLSVQVPPLVYWSFITEGFYYLALLAFLGVALIRILQLRVAHTNPSSVLLSAACVTLPYSHFVFSRPDIVHLAHGVPTMSLGVFAIAFSIRGSWRWARHVVAPILLVTSVFANFFHYGIVFEFSSPKKSLVAIPICGEVVISGLEHAYILASADYLAHELAKPDEAILFLPHMPFLYRFTGRRSPTNQLYFVFPASPEVEHGLIGEIEASRVQWVMMEDYPLDGRDDLRFRHTNPIVFRYLQEHFEPIKLESLPPHMIIMHRRAVALGLDS